MKSKIIIMIIIVLLLLLYANNIILLKSAFIDLCLFEFNSRFI